MVIYLGADHGGFNLKEQIKGSLKEKGYAEIFDLGNTKKEEEDDYPDFAKEVGRKVSENPEGTRGIVICRSGAGVDIVANKFPAVRSVLGISANQVFDSRHDDNVNVLSIAADFVDPSEAQAMVQAFLSTPFGREERFTRRLGKISEIESELYK